jgi:GxxExxY protein
MSEIVFKDESYLIIGACMEVHKKLGAGFLESVYSEALETEFRKLNIPFEREKKLQIYYEGKPMKKYFKVDFVCFGTIIVELKSSGFITAIDRRQSLNYLKATQFKLGIMVNFGTSSLAYKRIVIRKFV